VPVVVVGAVVVVVAVISVAVVVKLYLNYRARHADPSSVSMVTFE